jgi:hypothetical protein
MDIYAFLGIEAHLQFDSCFWFLSENIVFMGILALSSERLLTIRERRTCQIQLLGERCVHEIEAA